MSSAGYHPCYPRLLMFDQNPLHSLDESRENDDKDGWDDPEWDADESDEGHPAPSGTTDAEQLDPARALRELPGLPADLPYSMIELEKIPRRLWEKTLAPLHPQQRCWVVSQVADEQLRKVADELVFALLMADSDKRNARARARFAARRTGHPLPVPGTDATTRSSVQVNLRLRRDDHAKLAQAAAAVGLKPTTFARALVLNGVAMTLREHAAGPDDGRSSS